MTTPKFFCFTLMPFAEQFDDLYQFGVKQACEEANAYCERVDEQIFHERILDRIYNQIHKADLVIADMSDRNPNVFYEVGYAHALGKPTVLLTRDADDIPFDLKHFPHIVHAGKIAELKERLKERVAWFMAHAGEATRWEFPIELYLDEVSLASGNVIYTYNADYFPEPVLTVVNTGPKTLAAEDFKIGIVCGPEFYACHVDGATSTALPSGQILHILPAMGRLFPQEATTRWFRLGGDETPPKVTVSVRVFTDAGYRDFPMILEAVSKPSN